MGFTVDEVNAILNRFALEDAEKRAADYADALEEEFMNSELMKQYEAMQRASDLEDFSPFDTCNS